MNIPNEVLHLLRILSRQLLLGSTLCLCGLFAVLAIAAEEDQVLLTIQGHLIGRIDSLESGDDPKLVIEAYYDKLSGPRQSALCDLQSQLSSLIPGYEVAFTAADSAELTEVMSKIDFLWAGIQSIHSEKFTPQAREILNAAYIDAYSLIELKNLQNLSAPRNL